MKVIKSGAVLCMALMGAAVTPSPGHAQATDLVCGQCVETGDIATEAVTGGKLVPNAVSNARIANGAANAAKLAANAVTVAKIANGAVSTAKLTTAGVTRPKIAPNAVNASKIANAAVTAAKIAPDAVNRFKIADRAVSAGKLDIADTVFIEDSGDPVANCAALLTALGSLSGPAALLLGPGTYDCENNSIILPTGTSLIGAGRNLVTIVGGVDDEPALVELRGDNILLRGVTVRNFFGGVGTSAIALLIGGNFVNSRDWRIDDVLVEASGNVSFSAGIVLGAVDCDGGELTNVTARASGAGSGNQAFTTFCDFGKVQVSNLDAAATGVDARGISSSSLASLTVRNSVLLGGTHSVLQSALNPLNIISSELAGPISGTVVCRGAYSETGVALSDGTNGSGGCDL